VVASQAEVVSGSESKMSEAISYIFTWHSLSDTCPKCQRLNGKEYREQDLFQERLWDMIEGDIWDLDANHSLAHGKHQYNCRCQLEVRVIVEIEKMEEYGTLTELLEMFR